MYARMLKYEVKRPFKTGVPMPNAENIYPYQFRKGGRKGGAIKGSKSMTRVLRQLVDEPACVIPVISEIAEEMGMHPVHSTIGSVLCARLILEMMEGNGTAIREIMDRIDGKVADRVIQENNFLADISDEDLEAILAKQVKETRKRGRTRTSTRRKNDS